MKHRFLRIAAILLSLLFIPACSKANDASEPPAAEAVRVVEDSAVWSLSERYPLTYCSLKYFVTYEANGEPFCLTATRNKKETGMSKNVTESRDVNGIVFTLCTSPKKDSDNTFYECYTGSFRYFIGREDRGFHVENVLSMDDAIALMYAPETPKGDVRFLEAEWNAQLRTEACNLEILIRPNDNGALLRSLSSSYQEKTENGETYFVSSANDEIVYTNGVHSVEIVQLNRSGAEKVDYLTLAECKAILALLG